MPATTPTESHSSAGSYDGQAARHRRTTPAALVRCRTSRTATTTTSTASWGSQVARTKPAAAAAELVLREEVGQVGDGQQQAGGVGQPDRGERERQRAEAELGRQREPDRGEQDGGGVDAEHPRGDRREQRRTAGRAAAGCRRRPSGHVGADVEQPGVVAQVGHHLDQRQEQQDRPDALGDVEEPDVTAAG